MTDALTRRRRGFLRTGIVKVLPIRRSSDWLPENSDSAFMNTGAKVEYVVPRLQRSGQLVDPLSDITDAQKSQLARELGFKDESSLNIMKLGKENFWINKAVVLDKDGKFLDLSSPADFINYKILEVNLEAIAPSWEERYNKGTFKFAIVFEDEEAKIKNLKIDTKKEAYMSFGKIDGSVKKLSDFLWIHYLTNKEGKRLPNNPTLDYLRSEVGRIIEERPGEFLSIITDPAFDTKALIQKAINIGLIQRDGMTFKIFGEDTSNNSLEELIVYLLDERNNNIRISLIGKIEAHESGDIQKLKEKLLPPAEAKPVSDETKEMLESLQKMVKEALLVNQKLKEENAELKAMIPSANPVKATGRGKKNEKEE